MMIDRPYAQGHHAYRQRERVWSNPYSILEAEAAASWLRGYLGAMAEDMTGRAEVARMFGLPQAGASRRA